MATTAAQRQRSYREARASAGTNGERRINAWVSTAAALALGRLARHHGTSKRAILEQLILEADNEASTGLDPQAWDKYHDVTQ